MNEEEIYSEDQEERYFHRLRRWAKEKSCEDDMERENRGIESFSAGAFNAIWEGRGNPEDV